MITLQIPVATGKVLGTQTNFPVLINPTVMTGWVTLSLAEAQSLRFYSDSAKTTELAREVMSANEIYVKVPSITDTTIIYCDYDGIRADYAVTDTYGRNNVWSDYTLVSHLSDGENSTGGTDLTNTGSTPYSSAKIVNGADFNGSSSRRLGISDNRSFNWSNDYSWTFWFKLTSNTGYLLDHFTTTGAGRRTILYCNGSGITLHASGNERASASLSNGTYYKATVSKSGSTWTLYIDTTASSTISSGSTAYTLNQFSIGSASDSFGAKANAQIDEVRLKASTVSSNWVTSEYNNQNNVATFWGTVTGFGGLTNPTNAYSSNDVYATASTSATECTVYLSKDGGTTWSDGLSKTFTSTDTTQTYGTTPSRELWGLTWTLDDLSNTNFRLKVYIGGYSQIYKDFGFTATPATDTVNGIEVSIEAKATGGTFSLDHVKVKIYSINSLLQIVEGSQIYATDGRKAGEGVGAGTGVLTFYDGTNWIAVDTGLTVDD